MGPRQWCCILTVCTDGVEVRAEVLEDTGVLWEGARGDVRGCAHSAL